MSSGQDSTIEDPTETTPVEVTEQTIGSIMTSSSSRGVVFYFPYVALFVTIVGVAANGLVVYALVASKQHKKHVLIFNQNVLDFFNCLFLAVEIPIYLRGTSGYWLCMCYIGSIASSCGSVINLAAISIERYLKIVHHVWAKKNLRNWMIYSTIAFSWIAGTVIAAALMIPSTVVVNGVCYSGMFFLSPAAMRAFGI